MFRSLAVFGLAVTGLWVLAGPGWALVAGAGLAFALWPQGADMALAVGARRAIVRVRIAARRVQAAPRRMGAAAGMGAGVLLVPAGLSVASGIGVSLAAAGALAIGLSLLTGWGA